MHVYITQLLNLALEHLAKLFPVKKGNEPLNKVYLP